MKTNLQVTILLLVIMLITTSCGSAPTATSTETSQPIEPSAVPTDIPTTEVPPTQEPVTLTMNSSQLTSFAPIFIADAEGYFADEGITMQYETFNRTQDAIPLIITGDLDIYAGSINAGLLNIFGQEENIRVVADRGHTSASDPCTYHGMLVRKDLYDSGEISDPGDLKGKIIASSTTGPSGFFLSVYLDQAGLTFDDVTVTDLPPAGYVDAMVNKTVDVIVAPELRLSQVVNSGSAVLTHNSSEIIGEFQSSVLVFGKSLLVDNREAGVRFLRAYLRGIQQYNEGKTDRNVAIMAEYTGESEETLRNACWVSINNDGRISFEGVSGFQEWSLAQGDLDALITEEQFWDSSLLDDALNQ